MPTAIRTINGLKEDIVRNCKFVLGVIDLMGDYFCNHFFNTNKDLQHVSQCLKQLKQTDEFLIALIEKVGKGEKIDCSVEGLRLKSKTLHSIVGSTKEVSGGMVWPKEWKDKERINIRAHLESVLLWLSENLGEKKDRPDGLWVMKAPVGSVPKRWIPFQGDRVTLGSGQNDTIKLNRPGITPSHLEFDLSGEKCHIIEPDTDGVLVNNGKLPEKTPVVLDDGAIISIGEFRFMFRRHTNFGAGKKTAQLNVGIQCLRSIDANCNNKVWRIPEDGTEIVVGDSKDVDVFIHDEFLEKEHIKLRINPANQSIEVMDLGGTNTANISKHKKIKLPPPGENTSYGFSILAPMTWTELKVGYHIKLGYTFLQLVHSTQPAAAQAKQPKAASKKVFKDYELILLPRDEKHRWKLEKKDNERQSVGRSHDCVIKLDNQSVGRHQFELVWHDDVKGWKGFGIVNKSKSNITRINKSTAKGGLGSLDENSWKDVLDNHKVFLAPGTLIEAGTVRLWLVGPGLEDTSEVTQSSHSGDKKWKTITSIGTGMYAIMSDVHANLPAFKAVLENIKAQGVDAIFCCGDYLDYGAEPVETIMLAGAEGMLQYSVLGNHDAACIGIDDTRGWNGNAAVSAEWTDNVLTENEENKVQKQKLIDLPIAIDFPGIKVAIFHGCPKDQTGDACYEKYCFAHEFDPNNWNLELFKDLENVKIVFVGHMHIPRIFDSENDAAILDPEDEYGKDFEQGWNELEVDKRKYVVNVGSVGQPRDSINYAAYVLLDIKDVNKPKVSLVRVPYPIELEQQSIQKASLPDRNWERLKEGR